MSKPIWVKIIESLTIKYDISNIIKLDKTNIKWKIAKVLKLKNTRQHKYWSWIVYTNSTVSWHIGRLVVCFAKKYLWLYPIERRTLCTKLDKWKENRQKYINTLNNNQFDIIKQCIVPHNSDILGKCSDFQNKSGLTWYNDTHL